MWVRVGWRRLERRGAVGAWSVLGFGIPLGGRARRVSPRLSTYCPAIRSPAGVGVCDSVTARHLPAWFEVARCGVGLCGIASVRRPPVGARFGSATRFCGSGRGGPRERPGWYGTPVGARAPYYRRPGDHGEHAAAAGLSPAAPSRAPAEAGPVVRRSDSHQPVEGSPQCLRRAEAVAAGDGVHRLVVFGQCSLRCLHADPFHVGRRG